MFVCFNDKILPGDEAILSHNNRSFLYGDGLFESMRMIKGHVMFMDMHLQRLYKGMNMLQIKIPDHYTNEYFTEKINKLIAKNNITPPNARIRLNIFRSEGGLYTPVTNTAGYLLSLSPVHSELYEINNTGLKVNIYEELKKQVNLLSQFKTCNSLLFVLAGIWMKRHLLDDCILLNEEGHICEGLNANIFVVKDGIVKTPAVEEGCIKGVMRDVVISIIRDKKISINETRIEKADLLNADELFLTNAAGGIRWIGAFRDKRYFSKFAKEMVQEINELSKNG